MVIDQNPDTWNIPGSYAYNAIMVRLRWAIYGSPGWKDYWEALDGMVASTVVATVGAILCAETAGAGCMLAAGALAGIAGQCMDDCEDTQAVALAAVLGAATDGRLPKGAIRVASEAADAAAANAGSIFIKDKHLSTFGGNYAKFATADKAEAQSWVAEALTSDRAVFRSNGLDGTFKVETDMARAIGTKGQTGIRVIVAYDGRVINAFPFNPGS